jgi:hypothetical protein
MGHDQPNQEGDQHMQINSKRRSASRLVVFVLGGLLGLLWLAAGSALAAGPLNSTPPMIEGEAFEGRLLRDFPPGSWEGTGTVSVSIQWLRCDGTGDNCQAIEGAIGQNYTVATADDGSTLRVEETASDSGGSTGPVVSAPTAVIQAAGTADLNVPFSIATTRNAFDEDMMTVTNDEAVCMEFSFQGYFKGQPFANAGGPELEPGEAISFELPPELEGEPALMEFFHCGEAAGHPALEIVHFVFAQGYPNPIEPEPEPKPKNEPPPSKTATPAPDEQPKGGSQPPPGPSPLATAAQVTALLKGLVPSGKSARIGALLKHGALSQTVQAPEAGSLSVQWFALPPGAHSAKKTKPILVASGHMVFASAANGTIRVKLTAAGKRVFKTAQRLKLTVKESFDPVGGAAVSTTLAVVVRR